MKIRSQIEGQVLRITVNYPEKRNAFDTEMAQCVISLLKDATQKQLRVVIINAVDAHGVFSAGHNLEELKQVQELQDDPMFEMIEAINQLPIPVIAEVNGAVYAGALHMIMNCDLVYATKTSKIVMTANKMGLPFLLPHYRYWLAVTGMHKIKELFFTADAISAEDAYYAGIFNAVLETEAELKITIESVCDKIINCCGAGIANTKLQLNQLGNQVILDYAKAAEIEQARHALLSSDAFQQRVTGLLASLHKKSS